MNKPSFYDEKEFSQYALSLNLYLQLKQQNKLYISMPKEKCICENLNDEFLSLLSEYSVNDLMKIKNPEYKKAKERFLVCLFAFLIREVDNEKHQYDICLPIKDRGIDAYIRQIDYKNHLIIQRPIQICEMPEKYLKQNEKNLNPTKWIFSFIKKTKLKKYPKSTDALLVWLELENNKRIDIAILRELMLKETNNPFKQIIIMGRGNEDLFIVSSIYSSNPKNNFSFSYDYKTKEYVSYNIIQKN